jgi:predicted Zn-dependent protease
MQKFLFQLLITVILFFSIWFGLSQINFIDRAEIDKFSKENEKKLGELILKTIKATGAEIDSTKVKVFIDSMAKRICEDNNIEFNKLKIHLIESSEINAFALPDNNMVIYSGLLTYANTAEEVAGVMAHELGHMEKNHVMKKLVKEIGIAMLFTIAGGDAGFEIIKETARVLSSSAFDRSQETEADLYAVEIMTKAGIDPEHLGNFLFRLGKKNEIPEELAWLSTHPESKERAAKILEKKKEYNFESKTLLKTNWDTVKKLLAN